MFVMVFSEDMKIKLLANNWIIFKTYYKTDKDSIYYFYIKDLEYLKNFSDSDYCITNRMIF